MTYPLFLDVEIHNQISKFDLEIVQINATEAISVFQICSGVDRELGVMYSLLQCKYAVLCDYADDRH